MRLPKILIVDDGLENHEIFFQYFSSDDFDIYQATNGKQGYDIAVLELPDIIIMDWAMPIMNGIDAILKLKATQATKSIPVVMATGVMTESEDLKEALEAGAMDFIRKPFDPLELTARVHAALRLSDSQKALKAKNEEVQNLLRAELEQSKRELTLQAMHAHEKDKFLEELKDSLHHLRDNPTERDFRKLEEEIDKQMESGESWGQFMIHFEQVHPSFFEKLKSKGAGITYTDLRIGAYLRMGLANKEIANLISIEMGSVKNAITRLKKKLSLGSEDSIRDFILEL